LTPDRFHEHSAELGSSGGQDARDGARGSLSWE